MHSRLVADGGRRRTLPKTILCVVLLWVGLPLVQLWPDVRVGLAFSVEEPRVYIIPTVLSLLFKLSIATTMAWGVIERSTFIHRAAMVWQLAVAGFGAYTIYLNRYGWDSIRAFSQGSFFHGVLPIATGLISILVLLLPASRRWIAGDPTPAS